MQAEGRIGHLPLFPGMFALLPPPALLSGEMPLCVPEASSSDAILNGDLGGPTLT